MACNFPLQAFRSENGSVVVFSERARHGVGSSFKLPCGRCTGCRLERSRQWAIRCLHEASLYEQNSFVTLTYNDEHLPPGGALVYSDFQKFMRRLRKRFAPRKIRFFMAGEYGDERRRPHFHVCLFNCAFSDRVYFKRTASGSKIYTSKVLSSLWVDRVSCSMGHSSVGDVTFESAAYVARYIMKKILGRGVDPVTGLPLREVYEGIDEGTGEVIDRPEEFCHMSLKPGIGRPFFEKFRSEMFPRDYVVVNGVRSKPPKYYKKLLTESLRKSENEAVEFTRWERAQASKADNTRERLAVKERVLQAKVALLKRGGAK